jgi:hypothetical protein
MAQGLAKRFEGCIKQAGFQIVQSFQAAWEHLWLPPLRCVGWLDCEIKGKKVGVAAPAGSKSARGAIDHF